MDTTPKFRAQAEERPSQKTTRRTTYEVGGKQKRFDSKETELREYFKKEDLLVCSYWVTNNHKNLCGISQYIFIFLMHLWVG